MKAYYPARWNEVQRWWGNFTTLWALIGLYHNGLKCRICHGMWDGLPGTLYCSGQHGECGICGKPRASPGCKCCLSYFTD